MLSAINHDGKLINLMEMRLSEVTVPYFCPACHSPVVLKNGTIKVPHFAHKSLKNCASWAENESAQHLRLKMKLYEWLVQSEKVEVERYLPELEQTPDLLVNDKIAIEVQCSPLSLKRLRERTENYHTHGYTVIWLMGKDLWLRERATELQKNLMYFSENRGFYFWELDLAREQLRLKSLLHQDLREHLIYLTEEFPFGQGNLLDILRLPFTPQRLLSISVSADKNLRRYVQQQLFHCAPKWMKIQAQYYQAGKNVLLDVDFDRPWIAPVGLDLLSVSADRNFTQIRQDLTAYYQNFKQHFQEKQLEKLYPPRFYQIWYNRKQKK